MRNPNRRKALISMASGSAFALTAGGVWTATRDPNRARAAWRLADDHDDDVRLFAFGNAILAPSAFNMQPWQIRLDGTDQATLFCDLSKRLAAVDPFDRQTTIGFGAFLALTRIAAAQQGYRVDIVPFPQGPALPQLDERPIASMAFIKDADTPKDPLFAAIKDRRTVYETFDANKALPTSTLESLTEASNENALIKTIAARDRVSALRTITVDALIAEAATDTALAQTASITRIGRAQIEASPDGVAMSGAANELKQTLGILSQSLLTKRNSAIFRQVIEKQTRAAGSAMAYAWIETPDNTRESQLHAGEAYARMALKASALNVAIQPLSQALEEYPEMAEQRQALVHELNPQQGSKLQMLIRLGTARMPSAAPRWPLAEKIIAT